MNLLFGYLVILNLVFGYGLLRMQLKTKDI